MDVVHASVIRTGAQAPRVRSPELFDDQPIGHNPLPFPIRGEHRQAQRQLGRQAGPVAEPTAERPGLLVSICPVSERNAPALQVSDDRQEMRQGAAEPIQLPDHQAVTLADKLQAGLQPRSVIACA